MNPELAALINLQKTMEHYDALERRARDLPAQIAACKESHDTVILKHDEVVARLRQLRVDLHDAEVDLRSGEEQLAKKHHKLHEVKTNEEYKAGLHEIEIQKGKNSDAETRILELMDTVEAANQAVADSEQQLAQDQKEFAGRLKALEDELASLQKELERYLSIIDEKRSLLKEVNLTRFDRIYARNAGMALAPSNSGSCGYCQVRLAPHRIQAAREGREIVLCDHCGSILYWDEEPEQVPAG